MFGIYALSACLWMWACVGVWCFLSLSIRHKAIEVWMEWNWIQVNCLTNCHCSSAVNCKTMCVSAPYFSIATTSLWQYRCMVYIHIHLCNIKMKRLLFLHWMQFLIFPFARTNSNVLETAYSFNVWLYCVHNIKKKCNNKLNTIPYHVIEPICQYISSSTRKQKWNTMKIKKKKSVAAAVWIRKTWYTYRREENNKIPDYVRSSLGQCDDKELLWLCVCVRAIHLYADPIRFNSMLSHFDRFIHIFVWPFK